MLTHSREISTTIADPAVMVKLALLKGKKIASLKA